MSSQRMADRPIAADSIRARSIIRHLRAETGLDVVGARYDHRAGYGLELAGGRLLALGDSKRQIRHPQRLGALLATAGGKSELSHRSAHHVLELLKAAASIQEAHR